MNSENSKNSGAIVIDASKEKIEKLKKKWTKVNKVGTTLATVAASGFLLTLLSPFDFEGPIAEIITAVVAAVGFTMKIASESKLGKLKDKEGLDDKDKEALLAITRNVGDAISQNKFSKGR